MANNEYVNAALNDFSLAVHISRSEREFPDDAYLEFADIALENSIETLIAEGFTFDENTGEWGRWADD